MTEKNYHLGVKALLRSSDGKVLLLQKEFWDLPGGRVQKGQTIEETLRREVEEETGITDFEITSPLDTIIPDIEIALENGEKVGLILTVYACILPETVDIKLSTEHADYAWVPFKKAASLLSNRYPLSFKEKMKALSIQI